MEEATHQGPARTRAQQLGDWAEEVAAGYLLEKGFAILERKLRTRLGEVDLVAQKGVLLAFVEVRYRRSAAFGTPEETVTRGKRRKVILAAFEYARQRRLLERRAIRFDVVAVVPGRERPTVLHLEDAFEADLTRLAPPAFL
jgi:putative endonuclease